MARKRSKSKTGTETPDDPTSGGDDPSSKPSKRKRKSRSKKKTTTTTPKTATTKTPKKKTATSKTSKKATPNARQAEEERSAAATTEATESQELGLLADLDVGVEVGDLDLSADEAINKLLTETAALDDSPTGEVQVVDIDPADEVEPVVENVDVDLSDDLDEADARERLIAEALAFVEGEEDIPQEASDAEDAGESSQDGSDLAAEVPADDAPGESTDSNDGTSSEDAARFKIGPDALAALKQLRQQGLTTHLGDDVLDLGESGTPEDLDRLLAATLAYSEMQEAIYRVPVSVRRGRRWKGMAASIVFLVAAIVAVSPPAFVLPDPPASLTEADRLYGLRVTLILQSQQVEAFRTREQRLPDSLADVAARLPGVRFVKSGNRLYQLVAYTTAGEAVIYDSSAPAPEFAAISRTWATTRAGS